MTNIKNISIQVSNLTKRYQIGSGLKNLWAVLGNNPDPNDPNYHWAVRDVNFTLTPGEALGIIGPNGAGKTTILKLLSKVTQPTSGNIQVNGRFSSLIELGAGFHPDLSGRENVYLNGIILGMKRSEINERFDQIVEFAGIGDYLDTPVKRYSSGMHARLGFSIAAHVDPEILLVDEVLAVGDYAFQAKCYAFMDELRKNGTSLIFVSHNMEVVRRVCDRGIVMYKGEDIFHGTAAEAVVAYSDTVRQAARQERSQVPDQDGLNQRVMTFEAELLHVDLINSDGESTTVIKSGEEVTINVEVLFHKQIANPIFALAIRQPDGQRVYATTTHWLDLNTPTFGKGERWVAQFKLDLPLLDGTYYISTNVGSSDLSHYYDRIENALNFQVINSVRAKGVVDLDTSVNFQKLDNVVQANQ